MRRRDGGYWAAVRTEPSYWKSWLTGSLGSLEVLAHWKPCLAGSLRVLRPIKPVDIGENGNVVIADFADTGQPALLTLAERNLFRWKPRAETSIPRPSRTRNPSSPAPMRPPVFRCWTGNAACAASLAANNPSGLRIWALSRSSPSFGSATPFRNPVTAWRFEAWGRVAISAHAPTMPP